MGRGYTPGYIKNPSFQNKVASQVAMETKVSERQIVDANAEMMAR